MRSHDVGCMLHHTILVLFIVSDAVDCVAVAVWTDEFCRIPVSAWW